MLANVDRWVPLIPVATLAAPAPKVIPWKTRARTPLIALTVALVALDAIGLGLRWADASNQSIGDVTPRVLQPHVTAPDAVVSGSDLDASSSRSTQRGTKTTSRPGTTDSGALIGPVAPPVAQPTPGSPSPTPTPAVPLAQLDVAIPGVAQISVGAGDNSCTTVDLTVLALGECPTPTGEGPVIVRLVGSLLGGS